MKHQIIDVSRVLLIVVGIGGLATDQTFAKDINNLFGKDASAIIAGVSATAAIASTILHTVANPTPSFATEPILVPVPKPNPQPPTQAPVVEVTEVKKPDEPVQYTLPLKKD